MWFLNNNDVCTVVLWNVVWMIKIKNNMWGLLEVVDYMVIDIVISTICLIILNLKVSMFKKI